MAAKAPNVSDQVGGGTEDKRRLQDQSSSVDQAKDRAQMTASTATIVVQVGLLREILQQGDQMPYYMLSLILVILSVSLQVLGGLIAVCLNHYEAYYQKHEGDFCDDIRDNFCCCLCPATGIEDTLERRCCTCLALDYSAETSLREYYQWARRFGQNRKRYLQAEVELDYLDKETTIQRKGLETQDAAKRKKIAEQLRELHDEKRLRKEVLRRQAMDMDMGKFYQKRAQNVYRIQVLKKVTMWQHIINYILYAIFVINLFITGFGIAT